MRRWLKRGLILALILVGLPLALYFYLSWQAERELRVVVAELDAKHAPWRWDDLLAARQPVAAENDMLDLVLKVDKLIPPGFSAKGETDAVLGRPPHVALGREESEAFQAVMAGAEASLAEARKITSMPEPRLRMRWRSTLHRDIDIEPLQRIRMFVFLLRCAAVRDAQHGDLDRAADGCLAMLRACRALEDEVTMFPHLTRMSLESMSVASLQRVLAQGQPPPQRLARLQDGLEQLNRKDALVNALRGERAWSHEWFEGIATGAISVDETFGEQGKLSVWERIRWLQRQVNRKGAHAWVLRYATAVLESLDLPESRRRERLAELCSDVSDAPGIASLVFPPPALVEIDYRVEAQIRCTLTALAAERFRRAHGRWPATLGEVTPEFLKQVPADPYADQPLQLRTTGDGIVIYSIGPHGQQRGTYQEDQAAGRSSLMYEFRLWDVARRRQMPQP